MYLLRHLSLSLVPTSITFSEIGTRFRQVCHFPRKKSQTSRAISWRLLVVPEKISINHVYMASHRFSPLETTTAF